MSATTKDWEQAIKLLRLMSVEMLELAEAGGWDEVTHWEGKRRVLLDELFQKPPPAEFAPLLVETIRAVLASDARLRELARAEMGKLGDYLQLLHQNQRIRRAYHL